MSHETNGQNDQNLQILNCDNKDTKSNAISNANLNAKSESNANEHPNVSNSVGNTHCSDFIAKGKKTGQNQYQSSDIIVMSENYQSSNSEKIIVSENFEKSISNNNDSLTHRLDVLSSHIIVRYNCYV